MSWRMKGEKAATPNHRLACAYRLKACLGSENNNFCHLNFANLRSLAHKTSELFFLKNIILDDEILGNSTMQLGMIKIKTYRQNKIKTSQMTSKKNKEKNRKKMPVFNCICGAKILIIPDIPAMGFGTKVFP